MFRDGERKKKSRGGHVMVGEVNTSSSSSSSSYTYSARSYVPAQLDSKQRKRIMHRSVPKGYTSTTSPELRDSSHTPIHGPVPDSGQGDNPWANQALYHTHPPRLVNTRSAHQVHLNPSIKQCVIYCNQQKQASLGKLVLLRC